jgi:hypothetical protein
VGDDGCRNFPSFSSLPYPSGLFAILRAQSACQYQRLEVNVRRRTGHEGREWSRGISSTFSLTSELYGGGWLTPCLPAGRRLGTHRAGGWEGTRAGLDECGKSRPPPLPPGCPVHSTSLIPTELSWPTLAAVITWQSLVTRVNIGSVVQGRCGGLDPWDFCVCLE